MATRDQSIEIYMELVGAAVAKNRDLPWPYPGRWRVDAVRLAPANVVSPSSNFTTLALQINDGLGGGFTQVGSFDTETVGLSPGAGRAMALLDASARELTAGSILRLKKSDTDAGAALEGGVSILASRID